MDAHLLSRALNRRPDGATRDFREMGRATQRSIEILELIAQASGKWTHAQIARELAIPKSTLTDLLRDLVARGYLELNDNGEHLIGPSVLALSRSYLRRMDVVSRSR